ncbi:23S rRNA (pseudouridine1915-N3)-methyltransferase [Breznakia sp. PF5-3]|uniref:23S rRNA (pseudouridine(1915)-N(3))-methyltransferase RlmH n=1 Tax=unclassified Breznakia TaxID=2623764 RepID=UPI0024057AF5|nr:MULTISPECIES: 23S rRNA (pseudouridine(1915)-N(3))-methyltransferase RlmH [unclassified Breznakia]MDF9824792.1 23S rRNA (pseudouridine1915-N3)-methyltransferase [Breznakia sp. PM6-1]MDF9835752.1 23S rRNA (pseudouridine1915-N3)-methyltransferase [Breznakia sp. PF5-3]MDF9837838.1 23S rRNA (pseudouridine1915-N3)-methyltransferase [Breznakia sp. PFB2-8]MDF9859791.1 23S rRNA (pseudouridine1915-N3)-methyltransferase [Breznakia sp. PH5-24]
MIKIIGVGKIKDKNLKALCEEYKKRIQPYHKLEIIEVNDEAIGGNASLKDEIIIKDKEGMEVLKRVKDNDYMILLDLHGTQLTSEAFATKIEQIQTYHTSNITFVIGGSLGVSEALMKRSDFRFKLSDLTFLHQMTRLILLEQIYRSFKILHNETYHK